MRASFKRKCVKSIAALCAAVIALGVTPPLGNVNPAAVSGAAGRVAPGTTEYISNEYVGSRDYLDVLFNIDFQDIGASWARGAIYEAGALGIVKGFGASVYGGQATLTKGQAISLVIRSAGLEGAAQIEGEAMEAANRRAGLPPSDAETIWTNGCLKIAADIELITAEDYAAAMGDATAMVISAFRRGAAAQRQEFAYWIARALDVPAVRGQEALFTDYLDWRNVDALYVPYVEAALHERIINGDLQGRILPRDPITREQAAQVIKNASKFIHAKNGYTETTGTIEKIETDVAAGPEGANAELMRTVYFIRNQIGRLDTITTQIAVSDSAGMASGLRRGTGLVVYNGMDLDDETALRRGDRIRYISSRNRDPGYPREIRFVEILPGDYFRNYVLAQIDAIDPVNRRIAFTQIFPLEFPYTRELKRAAEAPQELLRLTAEYIYSGDVAVQTGGVRTGVEELAVGMIVIIGVENFRNLFYIETAGAGYHLGETGIARGIIEENNPVLGYISMYSESGDRTGIRSLGREGERPELMIYNYTDPSSIETRKDGFPAYIDDISAGDSAFIRFDESRELTAVSAVTNYKEKYGVVASVSGDIILVRYEDEAGVLQSLDLGPDVLYFKDYRLAGKSVLTPGSSVRVLLRDLGGATEVREITVMHEGDRGLAGSVYKAVLSRLDETSQKAIIYNVQRLVKGRWERTDRKGFDAVPFNAETKIYLDNTLMTPARANKLLRDNEVYLAVKNDYGGVEVAAQISVHGADDREMLYDGVVRGVRRPAGLFGLVNGPSDIATGDWTIVIKDGLLISGASIEQDDLAYVVASREDSSGRMRAEVVEIGDRAANTGIHIYRGRISKISRNKEFTLESYSELELNGTEWRYANTPKTFALTFDTLFLTADGVTSLDMFDSRGPYDYTDPPRTVYVLSDGTNALAISTAPYGVNNVRGEIIGVSGMEYDFDGALVYGPTGVTLTGVSYYDRSKYIWTQRKGDTVVTLIPNTLIIKDGAPVPPSALKKFDSIRVIKPDTQATGAGYIMIIEN